MYIWLMYEPTSELAEQNKASGKRAIYNGLMSLIFRISWQAYIHQLMALNCLEFNWYPKKHSSSQMPI